MTLSFSVAGDPIPQGSLRAFVRNGKPILTYGSAATLGAWRQGIASQCSSAMATHTMFLGPVGVNLVFVVRRPRGHYGTKGAVQPRFATPYPTVAPDLDKLVRAVLDGMTGIAYRDDAQVAELVAVKMYGESSGLFVVVRELVSGDASGSEWEPDHSDVPAPATTMR